MATYVALLRGINVGGNNKIDMRELKTSFEQLGFKEVTTYINSGNVIFDTTAKSKKDVIQKIEATIVRDFNLNIPVVLRSQIEIDNLIEHVPHTWKNDSEYKTDVWFLWDEYRSKETLKLIEKNPAVDKTQYFEGAIIWRVKKADYSKSKMNEVIKTDIYKKLTARNINTVRKIGEIMND
tara:strand:- start:1432 stop:1971 length:540 start_codon:yes stop_codon:yes gene_type:complete